MAHSRAQSLSVLVAAAAVGIGLAVAVSYWPHRQQASFVEGQTLLGKAADLLTDEPLGLQFKPPNTWSMQGRTLASPDQNVSPRLIVKYKRLIPNVPVAWLRVFAHQVPTDVTPAGYLQKRKPPEKNWKVTKEVEPDIRVGNQPAARITFAGPLDPNGRGQIEYTAEYIAIRRGNLILELSGMYPTTDETARNEWRASIESLVFLKP